MFSKRGHRGLLSTKPANQAYSSGIPERAQSQTLFFVAIHATMPPARRVTNQN